MKRANRVEVLFSDDELVELDRGCRKMNRGKFIRSCVFRQLRERKKKKIENTRVMGSAYVDESGRLVLT